MKHDEPVVSRRVFWSGGGWDCPWWKPLILDGIHGGDENCNCTIGVKLPGGALFLCLNVPLRQTPCQECRDLLYLDENPADGADGGLTQAELALMAPGTARCMCGHWDDVHGLFCMVSRCDCPEFTFEDGRKIRY